MERPITEYVRVTLTVPSGLELPHDLYDGTVDYHEGWIFPRESEARAFAEKAIADHPGVVVAYEIDSSGSEG